ncbi:MAG: L-seryl-tRNA(Sec) selenium transferase [bacterium]
MDKSAYLRNLPAVHELLRHPRLQGYLKNFSKELIVQAIRLTLNQKRDEILKSALPPQIAQEDLIPLIEKEITRIVRPHLRPVINATGVVLHTNLGRAPLGKEVLKNIYLVAQGYSNLEFDLQLGERGSRYTHVEEILCQITGAEAALVVNNNAAAVLLALNTLAAGKEVVVSRGELVEIGGSFRIPDVMKKSGANLKEVGTTNRTHLHDYEQAINEKTALLLKVHTSNFRILGFTAEVSLKDLVKLGRSKDLPVMQDLGSGCLLDLSRYGLPQEPTVQEALRAGADLVTFSGDKLLGGPQAGIILGQRKYVDLIKKNPLNRAVRIDKLTLAGLEATLRIYLDHEKALAQIPVLKMLIYSESELKKRAKRLQRAIAQELSSLCQVQIKKENSPVGGGSLPLHQLPTWVVALRPFKISISEMEKRLREQEPPIIARIQQDEILLDLRTIDEKEEKDLLLGLRNSLI